MIGLAQFIWAPGVSRPMAKFFQSKHADRPRARPRSRGTRRSPSASRSLVAIGLRIVLTRFRFGIAMRAAVDDRALSALNGARPNRVSMLAWALGTVARRARRHPHRPRTSRSTRRRSSLLIVERVRGRDLRPAPKPAAHVRRRDRRSASPRATSPGTSRRTRTCPACGSRAPRSCCSSSCSILPNPRLRGRMARSREYFPMPTIRGALDLRRRRRVRRRRHDDDALHARPAHVRAHLPDRDRRALARAARRASAGRSRCAS